MDFIQEFDKIRPYNDSEVPNAIQRIISEKKFQHILSFLYSKQNIVERTKMFTEVQTVNDFQSMFSHYAVREIIRKTSDGLTFSGIDKLDNSKPYLFIANHRDIVLDSAIMQILLVENNHKTSQITFGSNLMSGEFIIDIGKLNKMFTFYRGGSKLQMYRNALLHSAYIRHVLTKEKESLWIAQRDGRTKDGDDKTQAALIKMLVIGKKDIVSGLKELNIVPVTISYEYESCDAEKIQALYNAKREVYIKHPEEDLNSILNGIKNYKGKIHLSFGTPINSTLDKLSKKEMDVNEIIEKVIKEIDNQIYKNYSLWAGNYVAYDIIDNTHDFYNSKYNNEQKQTFLDYVNNKVSTLKGDKEELTNMFFRMYANPVFNKLKAEKMDKLNLPTQI